MMWVETGAPSEACGERRLRSEEKSGMARWAPGSCRDWPNSLPVGREGGTEGPKHTRPMHQGASSITTEPQICPPVTPSCPRRCTARNCQTCNQHDAPTLRHAESCSSRARVATAKRVCWRLEAVPRDNCKLQEEWLRTPVASRMRFAASRFALHASLRSSASRST